MQAPSRQFLSAFFLREWQHPSGWQFWLRPLSWLFCAAVRLRALLYRCGVLRIARVPVPVVVIGNITVGGTGKTPVVIALVEALKARGFRPAVATRGYVLKESPNRDIVTDVRNDDGTRVGDEPRLIAMRTGIPVFAGAARAKAARRLLDAHPDVDVIVCDDGLQHYALSRDVEIAVIDGARGFGNGAYLPAGPLREPPRRLDRVDALVVNRTGRAANGVLDATRFVPPAFEMTLGREMFKALFGHTHYGLEETRLGFAGKRIHAVAGTGDPERFFAHLERLGFMLHGRTAFPDHHDYVETDFAQLDADIVLVTEKDAVKLPLVARQFPQLAFWIMRVEAELPDAFYDLIVSRLQRHARHVH